MRGLPAALRFRVPQGQIVAFNDLVHGEQRFNTDDIGDFIIRRTDGSTAFFFSNAVDDALMGVTLVLRGDDHMTNTPRQILILRRLGLRVPQYAHVALLLGMDGAPLSKRHGDTSLRDLRERGYLPGALRNHLVRLGHSCVTDGWLDDEATDRRFRFELVWAAPPRSSMTRSCVIGRKRPSRICPREEFLQWIAAELPAGLDAQRAGAVRHRRARATSSCRPMRSSGPRWCSASWMSSSRRRWRRFVKRAKAFSPRRSQSIGQPGVEFKQAVKALGQATGKKGPALFMPLRAALTGFTHGPELAPMLALLPADEVQARLEHARGLAV